MSVITSAMRTNLKQELKKFNTKEINFRKYQIAKVNDATEEIIITNEIASIQLLKQYLVILDILCLQKHMTQVCSILMVILTKIAYNYYNV